MKKFLKTLAVCFMALVSCFTFFACNEPNNPDTPNNPEQSTPSEGTTPSAPTTAQINEANYTKMKTLVTDIAPENGFKLEITEEGSSSATVDYTDFDYTAMEMTEDEFKEFKAMKDSEMKKEMEDSQVTKKIIAYNATDKTGYTLEYEDEELRKYSVSTADTLYLCDITRNDSDESDGTMTASEDGAESETPTAPTYTYDKYKYNVDDKYFNQYIYDFNDEIGMMLKTIVQDSISDLETAMSKMFSEMGLTGESTTTINCTESDGVTTMVISSSLGNIPSFNMGFELKNFSMVVTMEIKFNATKVLSIDGKTTMSGTMSMDLSEMSEEDGDGETPAPVLTINMVINADNKYVFDEYNDTDKPEIVDKDYRGTGHDDEVVDKVAYVTLFIDGIRFKGYSRTMSDTFDKENVLKATEYGENLADVFTNLKNVTWYIDKECTIPYTGTTYTSYDINLYAKLSDMGLAKGKAIYRQFSANSYDESMDYSDYLGSPQIGDTTVVVDGTNYTCAYVNGEKYNAGESYTLDATKINEIIFVCKPDEKPNDTENPSYVPETSESDPAGDYDE